MPYLKEYHILISHSWDYGNHYQTICDWLNKTNYFRWSNYSVPLTNPLDENSKRELREKLKNRISSCSCIIVLSGMYVDYSEWIDFEIECILRRRVAAGALRVATRRYEWPALIRLLYVQS